MKLKAPLDIQIEITEGCNYSCIHCYNKFLHNGQSMSKTLLNRIIEEVSSNEVFDVVLTGGEPFLNKEVLYYGIERLVEEDIFVYVNTNLSIPLRGYDAKKLNPVKNVLFSFPSQDVKTFMKITKAKKQSKVYSNLELLNKEGVNLSANQVVSLMNLNDVYNTGKFLFKNFNISRFSATPANPSGCSRENFMLRLEDYKHIMRQLISLEQDYNVDVGILTCIPHCLIPIDLRNHKMVKRGCSSGNSTLGIGINGGVRKCIMLPQEYGNLHLEPLKVIWDRIISEDKQKNIHCVNCFNVSLCGNGCEYRALENGIDTLIQGKITELTLSPYDKLDQDDIYRLKEFRTRKETYDECVIMGKDFLLTGNSKLVSLIEKLSRQSFSLEEIRKKLGIEGVGLLNYLNIRGLIEKDENSKI